MPMSTDAPKRLRMFAGPNGSGKSTIVRKFSKNFSPHGFFQLYSYINADDLLRNLEAGRGIQFADFGLSMTMDAIRDELVGGRRIAADHPFLTSAIMVDSLLTAPKQSCDSYIAAAIVDSIREQLLIAGKSFSFETVMSHPSKVEFFARARAAGYRTYLYFVATEKWGVNAIRVENRAKLGGHDVPEDKIRERYERTLHLVKDALIHADRAYLFDNSGLDPLLLAELNPDGKLELQVPKSSLPNWFETHVASHFVL
jgi:predicted ABC-type ATPase